MANYETVFNESFDKMLGNNAYNAAFIGEFYRLFFNKSPLVTEMFANTNMSAQKTMLHDSLYTMVEFYRSKQLTSELRHLARVHGKSGRDIPLHLYDLWLDSLMEALYNYDSEFDEQAELAWRLVMTPGITYIKFMSNQPPKENAKAQQLS